MYIHPFCQYLGRAYYVNKHLVIYIIIVSTFASSCMLASTQMLPMQTYDAAPFASNCIDCSNTCLPSSILPHFRHAPSIVCHITVLGWKGVLFATATAPSS
eukprot:c41354_g1_i1 orf=21-323(-)